MLYPIAIEHGDATHAYGVTVPDIPGCFSAGETLDEAITNAREGIEGHLAVLADEGADIPVASSIETHHHNPEFNGYIWAVVDVDISKYMGKAEKINVTLPSRLIYLIDAKVATDSRYKSRSGFLAAGAEMMLRQA